MNKKNLTELINEAKKAPKTPTQMVQTLDTTKPKIEEVQIAFHVSKDLYKKVKILAFEREVSIKSILNQSIEKYINDIS